MNFAELNQIVDRNKIKTEAIELRRKIAHENEKIIKLRVGQDTAFWEQKEKMSSMERDHEALQRNMAQMQMEYETLSTKYQDELRKRPELLNKVTTAGELRRVLQENMNRVRATLERSSADRAALADAYARADATVTAAHANFEKRLQEADTEARQIRNMLRASEEAGAQAQEAARRDCARADRAAAAADQLREQKEVVAAQLAHANALLQEREKAIQEHRNELQRFTAEFNERQERSIATIAELEREAGAASSLRVSLKQAEMRAQGAACDVTRIASELAVAQADKQSAVASLKLQAQEAQSHIQKMEEFMNYIKKTNESLIEKIKEKDENIQSLQKVAAEYQKEINERMVDLSERAETIEKLTSDIAEIKEARERDHRSYEEREAIHERERRDFEEQITANQRELVKGAEIIEKLTRDIAETKAVMSHAEATVAEQAAQIGKERKNSVQKIEAIETELSEYTKTIARLNREITEEANARQQAEIALRDLSNKVERERSICQEKTTADQCTIEKLLYDIAKIKEVREREHLEYEERIASNQRKLIEHVETIDNLTTQIAKMNELEQLHSRAEIVIEDLTKQLQKDHEDRDQRVHELESKLAECATTIARLELSTAEETNAHAQAKTTLADIQKERETERRDFENRVTNIERELLECKNANASLENAIVSLENKLAEEREALSRANAALAGVKAELDREHREFEERHITTERELSERNSTIEQFRREVSSGAEERARLEAELSAIRLELNKEIKNTEQNREEIRKLREEAWRKEIENGKQIRMIRSLNNEKNLVEKNNEELKNTIKNIKKIADPKSGTALSQLDDNAVLAPPTPPAQAVRPAAHRPLVPRFEPNENVLDAVYMFNQESNSMETWPKTTNPKPRDDHRHFKDISHHGPSTILQAIKRQHDTVLRNQMPNPVSDMPAPDRLLAAPTPAQSPPERPRKFFKTKRSQRKERKE